jgi:hypothetical protein
MPSSRRASLRKFVYIVAACLHGVNPSRASSPAPLLQVFSQKPMTFGIVHSVWFHATHRHHVSDKYDIRLANLTIMIDNANRVADTAGLRWRSSQEEERDGQADCAEWKE